MPTPSLDLPREPVITAIGLAVAESRPMGINDSDPLERHILKAETVVRDAMQ